MPLNLSYQTASFDFKSWNLFVALCALPSLVLGLWLFAFPESPKFLLECGETDAALEVFKWIYAQNTGNDPDSYPVSILTIIFSIILSRDNAYQKICLAERDGQNCVVKKLIHHVTCHMIHQSTYPTNTRPQQSFLPDKIPAGEAQHKGQEHASSEAAQTQGSEGTDGGSLGPDKAAVQAALPEEHPAGLRYPIRSDQQLLHPDGLVPRVVHQVRGLREDASG